MSILGDTGAWYAVADTSDHHYGKARRFCSEHAGHTPLATTDLIVAEAWAIINSHLGRSAAMTFWDTLRETRMPVLAVEPIDLEVAWRIVHAFPDQDFSFVDCTTFALMERMGIVEAFTFSASALSVGSPNM